MLNTVYQLVAPRRFEVLIRDEEVGAGNLVIRPTYLSICNADQRYYQGTRGAAILAKKLPMALIHEGIGEVVLDNTGTFKPGDAVAMIPNLPTEEHDIIAENYLRSSKFRASSADGFMQELIVTTPDRVVGLPQGLNPEVAAFTELVSVVTHAVNRFDKFSHDDKSSIGIWGDGNVGFIAALLLKKKYPSAKVIAFGLNEDKLSDFTFADATYTVGNVPEDLVIAHAFECAGGNGSVHAIDQIIDHIQPEGTISLLGVTENPVPINTRMVLEKGLRLYGSSRSGREDFQETLNLYAKDPSIASYLERIIGHTVEVTSIADMVEAFEVDINKRYGKTIMKWRK